MIPNEKGVMVKINRGKHHWDEDRWIERAETFLNVQGFNDPTDLEVAITAIFLYPALGPT